MSEQQQAQQQSSADEARTQRTVTGTVVSAKMQKTVAVSVERLVKHDRAEIDAFRNAVPHLPGVLGVFHMAGAEDYLLHVAARDAEELRQFVLAHLTGHPAVAHTETNLIFEYADGDGWQKLVG